MGIPKNYNKNEMLYCQICGTSYLPEPGKLKENAQFDIPTDQEHQPEPAITCFIGGLIKSRLKEIRFIGAVASLGKRGIKITNYRVADGAGRPITEKEEDY
ncbi:MAG TPA: hypothetical protein VKA95_06510 [Nitrososphaeraceae archaeon]|nr:hypothetical protein [Nitrososphaeraceae archaeon]